MPAIPRELESILDRLSPEERAAVARYAAELARTRPGGASGVPRFDWAGCLGHLKGQYTSVALQHAISDWRSGGS